MNSIEEVIKFYSLPEFCKFWSKASKRAIGRTLGLFRRSLDWNKTILAHLHEFAEIQNTRGYILTDFKNNELMEDFFKRLSQRLHELDRMTEREKQLMDRVVVLKTGSLPQLRSERAKAEYLAACLEIGRLKPQSALDDIARKGGRWWDSLIPET